MKNKVGMVNWIAKFIIFKYNGAYNIYFIINKRYRSLKK